MKALIFLAASLTFATSGTALANNSQEASKVTCQAYYVEPSPYPSPYYLNHPAPHSRNLPNFFWGSGPDDLIDPQSDVWLHVSFSLIGAHRRYEFRIFKKCTPEETENALGMGLTCSGPTLARTFQEVNNGAGLLEFFVEGSGYSVHCDFRPIFPEEEKY